MEIIQDRFALLAEHGLTYEMNPTTDGRTMLLLKGPLGVMALAASFVQHTVNHGARGAERLPLGIVSTSPPESPRSMVAAAVRRFLDR